MIFQHGILKKRFLKSPTPHRTLHLVKGKSKVFLFCNYGSSVFLQLRFDAVQFAFSKGTFRINLLNYIQFFFNVFVAYYFPSIYDGGVPLNAFSKSTISEPTGFVFSLSFIYDYAECQPGIKACEGYFLKSVV